MSICPRCKRPLEDEEAYICCAGVELRWRCADCHKVSEGFAFPYGMCPFCKGKLELLESIYKKFEESEYIPGVFVVLTDEEFEVYAPLAIMKGQDLAPDIAMEIMQIMKCVLNAVSERKVLADRATEVAGN